MTQNKGTNLKRPIKSPKSTELLSTDEVAALLGKDADFVELLTKNKKLIPVQTSKGCALFAQEDVINFMTTSNFNKEDN